MKKAIAILLIVLSFCLVLFTSCKKSDIPAGMEQISDTSLVEYIMYAPKSWIVDSAPGKTTGAHVSESDRTSISVQKLSYSNLDAWWSDYRASISSQFKSSYKLLEENTDVLISGLNAKKHIFTVSFGATLLKYELYGVMHGGSVYTITVVYYGAKVAGIEGDTISYTDKTHGDTMKTIIDNFKFVEKSEDTEPVFNEKNTPENMKCASNTKIVDYYLFVPSSWRVEKTAGSVSAASIYKDNYSINVNVMQTNGSQSNQYPSYTDESKMALVVKLWRNDYFAELYSVLDPEKIPVNDKNEYLVDDNGLIQFQESDKIKLGKTLEETTLDGNKAYICTYSLTLDNNTYNYYLVSTFRRSSVYNITFTIKGDDSFDNYTNDINQILTNFKFD